MNNPTIPITIMPPSAPISTTGIGTSTPRPSSKGLSTLSTSPATNT